MATISYVVSAIDSASATFARIAGSADDLNAKLDDLSHKSATARVGLDGDKKTTLALDAIDLRMARLAHKVAQPEITLKGKDKALLDIAALNLALDRLDSKSSDLGRSAGLFSRLFGWLPGVGGGGGSSGGGGIGGFLGKIPGAASAAGGVLGPAAAGAGIGLGVSMLPAALPAVLGAGVGGAGVLLLDKISKPFADAVSKLGGVFKTVLAGALTGGGPSSFASGVTSMLAGISSFVKGEGPQLGQLFRASLPFLESFVSVLEQSAKVILPAMTQSLKQMAPYLPMLTKGFVAIAQGLAGFLKNLGPGMKDASIIFETSGKVIGRILSGLGLLVSAMAVQIVRETEIAESAIRFLERTWDSMYRGASAVISSLIAVVKMIPGQIMRAISSLPSMLFGAGKAAILGFIGGLGSMLSTLESAAENIGRTALGGVEKFLHIKSPSQVMFDRGVMTVLGFELGLNAGLPGITRSAMLMSNAAVPSGYGYGSGYAAPAGAREVHYHFHVDPAVAAASPALGRQIADHLKVYVRRGGQLYPAGYSPR